MIRERRAGELFRKAKYRMQSLASTPSTAPMNMQIQLKAYCFIWELKQEYKGEGAPSYMTKKAHERALERVRILEDSVTAGAHRVEALEAVEEAKEYLSILAINLIRDTKKTRVY